MRTTLRPQPDEPRHEARKASAAQTRILGGRLSVWLWCDVAGRIHKSGRYSISSNSVSRGTAAIRAPTTVADWNHSKAPPAGFEPATFGLGTICQVHGNQSADNTLGKMSESGCSHGYRSDRQSVSSIGTDCPKPGGLTTEIPAAVLHIANRWADLSPHVKDAILTLVDSSSRVETNIGPSAKLEDTP